MLGFCPGSECPIYTSHFSPHNHQIMVEGEPHKIVNAVRKARAHTVRGASHHEGYLNFLRENLGVDFAGRPRYLGGPSGVRTVVATKQFAWPSYETSGNTMSAMLA